MCVYNCECFLMIVCVYKMWYAVRTCTEWVNRQDQEKQNYWLWPLSFRLCIGVLRWSLRRRFCQDHIIHGCFPILYVRACMCAFSCSSLSALPYFTPEPIQLQSKVHSVLVLPRYLHVSRSIFQLWICGCMSRILVIHGLLPCAH